MYILREAAFESKASATSIVASYACSFRLRRFASPLEKQSRPWRPVNSNQRFEYDRLVRGRNLRHWRKSAHLPLHPFAAPSDADILLCNTILVLK